MRKLKGFTPPPKHSTIKLTSTPKHLVGGFTLIELLVVIAIVGLMTTMSAASIFSARNKRSTKSVAEQVKNVIMEAHTYSISPKTKNIDGSDVGKWPVKIVILSHSVKTQVNSDIDFLDPVTVSSKITLSCTANPCLSFNTDNVNNLLGQETVRGVITATNVTGERYQVTVSPLSGNVTITKL